MTTTRFRTFAALALAVALVAGCSGTLDGQPTFPGSSGRSVRGVLQPSAGGAPSYHPPPNNSGYSTRLFDQPQPLPSHLSRLGCKWLSSFEPRLAALHPTGSEASTSGCQVDFAGGEVAQIRAFGPYSRVVDETTYLKATTVAGLEGRVYSYTPQSEDKICSVVFNPRALTGITVDGYNTSPTSGDFQAHCKLAQDVAEVVAKTYVPDAGGHPYPGTPQQPSAKTLQGATACEVVGMGSVIYANDVTDDHAKEGHTAEGSTCDYTSDLGYGSIHVLLTPPKAGGLDGIIPKNGTNPVRTYLGEMRARQQQRANGCMFSVELSTHQVVQLDYTLGSALTDDSYKESTCFAAQAVLSSSLMDLMSSQ